MKRTFAPVRLMVQPVARGERLMFWVATGQMMMAVEPTFLTAPMKMGGHRPPDRLEPAWLTLWIDCDATWEQDNWLRFNDAERCDATYDLELDARLRDGWIIIGEPFLVTVEEPWNLHPNEVQEWVQRKVVPGMLRTVLTGAVAA